MRLRIFVVFFSLTYFLSLNSYAACNVVNGKTYGDCSGYTVNTQSRGPITVSRYMSESGIISGAKIISGGSLHLSGVCEGDVNVGKGGTLVVTGMVNGTVINNGGSVLIEGQVSNVTAISGRTTIRGMVGYVNGNSKVTYKKGAVIGGKPIK